VRARVRPARRSDCLQIRKYLVQRRQFLVST
jgi:hypothetical protein